MHTLPGRLEHLRDRVLREPDDLEVRLQLPQLAGDREVTLRVSEPDRAGDVERARMTPSHRPLDRALLRALAFAEKLAQEQIDLDRVAHVRRVCRPFERDERAAGRLRERRAACVRRLLVLVPVDDEHGTADTGGELARLRLVGDPRSLLRGEQDLGRGLQPPFHAVLDLLRRVRLPEHLRDEELHEAGVVAQPVVAVVLRPPFVGVELDVELRQHAERVRRRDRQGRADERRARNAVGVVGREQEPALAAEREADDRGALGRRSRRARREHRRRTRSRRTRPRRAVGRTCRCRARRTSAPGSAGRSTAAASSSGASGRATTSAGRGRSARRRPGAPSGHECRPAR